METDIRSQPQPPTFGQPHTARPQSHRFLQETLTKLSQDSMRAGACSPLMDSDLLNSRAPSLRGTSPGPGAEDWRPHSRQTTRASPSPDCDWQTGHSRCASSIAWQHRDRVDTESLRNVVREEVQDALNGGALAQFLEGWSSQFVEWRKIDDQVARQMRGHLEELEEVNRRLLVFLQQYVTTPEFTAFRETMTDYARLVEELTAKGTGRHPTLLAAVEEACQRTVSATVMDVVTELKEYRADLDVKFNTSLESVQKELVSKFGIVQHQTGELKDQIKCQEIYMRNTLEGLINEVGDRVENQLRFTAGEVAKSSLRAAQEGAAEVKMVAQKENESLRRDVTRLVAGSDTTEECILSVVRRFEDHLMKGVGTKEEIEIWRQAFENERQERQASQAECRECQAGAEELQLQLRTAGSDFENLSKELTQAQIAARTPDSWAKISGTFDEVVARGRLKMSLEDQEIEIVTGMNFVSRKPGEAPVAEWQDPEAAEASLNDAVELLLGNLSGMPVVIESHVPKAKAKPEFWQELAQNRAEFVRECLDQKGVVFKLMNVASFYGDDGLGRQCIRIKLKLFKPKEENPGKASKASPRGKRK
eukprot:TRINITY_DN63743_c0_g1_i1.p1 TRINITY_DN63743_c0_g1~~TRINITY_DN63743_c0_g1_i1.p1  ORF type:complete len:592 (-),score=134.28 TRINITY_DN63743_c0_g1_i1:70-1845(-)